MFATATVTKVFGCAAAGYAVSAYTFAQVHAPATGPAPGGGASVGDMGAAMLLTSLVTAAITALGTSIVQPWLRTEDLARQNAEMGQRLQVKQRQISDLIERLEDHAATEERQAGRLARLTQRAVTVAQQNLRFAEAMLVASGRVERGSAEATLALSAEDLEADRCAGTILLVQGEPGARLATMALLERHGYRVVCASGAEAAVRALGELVFTAVIVDVAATSAPAAAEARARDVLRRAADLRPSPRVIVLAGPGGCPDHMAPLCEAGSVLTLPIRFDEELLGAIRGNAPAADLPVIATPAEGYPIPRGLDAPAAPAPAPGPPGDGPCP